MDSLRSVPVATRLVYVAGLGRPAIDAEPLVCALATTTGGIPVYSFGTADGIFDDLAAASDRVAAALDPGALLIGHSMGGLVAEVTARRYPLRVGGLVLLDSSIAQRRSDGLPAAAQQRAARWLGRAGNVGKTLAGNLNYRRYARLTYAARQRWPHLVRTLAITADTQRGTRWGIQQATMARSIGAEQVLLAGASHLLATRYPERVAGAIGKWLG